MIAFFLITILLIAIVITFIPFTRLIILGTRPTINLDHNISDLGDKINDLKSLGHKSTTQPTAVLKIEGHDAEVVSARQLDHSRSAFSAAVRAR